ncbi:hypothetical protein [Desulfosarcina cetonica]|uniref:hypothetical protein n=1 Tax=Desulfosarcina cetonica TaxID=90730 RepID=UPI001C464374|nr:hypothetical protein [Desulfosarcina cetonica]
MKRFLKWLILPTLVVLVGVGVHWTEHAAPTDTMPSPLAKPPLSDTTRDPAELRRPLSSWWKKNTSTIAPEWMPTRAPCLGLWERRCPWKTISSGHCLRHLRTGAPTTVVRLNKRRSINRFGHPCS